MSSIITQWQTKFDEALASIERFRQHDNPDMRRITRWLMETSANAYSFLPPGWAGCYTNAQHFAALLQTIHHALVDDGDITFVAVNGRPMIVFVWRDDLHMVELRTEVEQHADTSRGRSVSLEVIDGVEAFIARQDRYERYQDDRIALGDRRRAGQLTMDDWRTAQFALEAEYQADIKLGA